LVRRKGTKIWTQIATGMGNRSDVQCRYHFFQLYRDGRIPAGIVPEGRIPAGIVPDGRVQVGMVPERKAAVAPVGYQQVLTLAKGKGKGNGKRKGKGEGRLDGGMGRRDPTEDLSPSGATMSNSREELLDWTFDGSEAGLGGSTGDYW
jgi:hypothetical protein